MQKYLQDQRGAAMFFELLLVAGVLTLVGVALYQANHAAAKTTAVHAAAVAAPVIAANGAATAAEQDATAEATLSAGAETAVNQVTAADTDVSNLGGSFNANNF